jgi:hypothetical protein
MLDDRRRSVGGGPPAVPLLLLPALSCVSEVLVAMVPLTDFVSAVNVIVLTLKRTYAHRIHVDKGLFDTLKMKVFLV